VLRHVVRGGSKVVYTLQVRPGTQGATDAHAPGAVEVEAPEPARQAVGESAESGRTPLADATARLSAAAAAYEATRVRTDGVWAGLAAAITNNLHWMVCLQPETGRRYTPAGRRWIFPAARGGAQHWTIFEWDSFLNALELAVESPALARSTLDSVLATQYPNGCMPNWRGRFFGTPGRSQPPIGAFCVLKLYLRTGDRSILEHAFPFLERWSDWWYEDKAGRPRRDGNANGLSEWGTDLSLCERSPAKWENTASGRQLAAWESGQDDLPNWDDAVWNESTETLELDAVDLNSYLALDHECLARIAAALGDHQRASHHRRRHAALAEGINGHLWDEGRGLYADRHWDGRFSDRVASSNFLPLLAGIVPPERVSRMLSVLGDEKRFWGEHVVPTVSRADPAFADQQYWRGTIWPPTNYLLYQGLRRVAAAHGDADALAAELAARSASLFLKTWRRHQLCCENYDARTGTWGGRRYQSWGPLLALVGVEEFLDVTPWDGLRIGTPSPPGDTTLERILVRGRNWTVRLSTGGMKVEEGGRTLLIADQPVVLRHVEIDGSVLTAEVTSHADTTIRNDAHAVQVPGGTHPLRLELPAALAGA